MKLSVIEQSAKKFGNIQRLVPNIAKNKYVTNLNTIIDKIAVTNTRQTMKTAYFSIYGHSGNKTTAIIPNKIRGNSHVFCSAESNLNEANFASEMF